MLHVASVAISFASLFVSALVFNDIEERAVDPVDRQVKVNATLTSLSGNLDRDRRLLL